MHLSDFVLLLNTLWFGGAFIQFSVAQGNTLKILLPREERSNPIAPTLVGQRGLPGRDQSADRPSVVLSIGRSTGLLPADRGAARAVPVLSPPATSASSPITFRS